MSSPTQRTLERLRKEGFTCAVVERWNAFAKIRQDLFQCIDVLGIRPGIILGIQATSASNLAARVKKSVAEPRLRTWLESGGLFEVWGWGKKKQGNRRLWQVTRRVITLEDVQRGSADDCETETEGRVV